MIEITPIRRVLHIELACSRGSCGRRYRYHRLVLDAQDNRAFWFACHGCLYPITMADVTSIGGDNSFPVRETMAVIEKKRDAFDTWRRALWAFTQEFVAQAKKRSKFRDGVLVPEDKERGLPAISVRTSVHDEHEGQHDEYLPLENISIAETTKNWKKRWRRGQADPCPRS